MREFIEGLLVGGFAATMYYEWKYRPVEEDAPPPKPRKKLFRKPIEILEPTTPEVEALAELFEENKKKGVDTKL